MAGRRKRLTAAERRAQLIGVGRKVFARHGYEATSVEQLAKAAKVSKPIIYEHFGGKEGLYAVVIDREMEHVVTLITKSISTGSPRERAEQAALAFLMYVKEEPDGFAVLRHDSPTSQGASGLSSMLSTVAERVGAVFADSFKSAGYNTKYAPLYAHALIGMVTFVGQWWTDDAHKHSVEDAASHLSGLAWMGLRHLPKDPTPVRPISK
ncbi:MAG: AcrR family transcriptional regulator [Polyangiales bacterium]|jgi:AcrR family transcriptional regulator